MDNWRQRSKLMLDEILIIDPYYSLPDDSNSSEINKPVAGLASYADITAGRSSPNSRSTSPYKIHQPESFPINTTSSHQSPSISQVISDSHKIRSDQSQDSNDSENLPQKKQKNRKLSTSHSTQSTRRGRSPIRRSKNIKIKQVGEIPQIKVTSKDTSTDHEFVQIDEHSKAHLISTEIRKRSPSPIWIPGSTSYADILRGGAQNYPHIEQPTKHEIHMTKLSNHNLSQITDLPKENYEVKKEIDSLPVKQVSVSESNIHYQDIDQASTLDINKKESLETTKENYNMPHEAFQNMSTSSQAKIYDYVSPMPELVSFINTELGAYPFVYTTTDHHQHELDTSLNPYDTNMRYPAEHYVTQDNYLTTNPHSYQQSQTCTQQQHEAANEILYYNPTILNKSESEICQSYDSGSNIQNNPVLPEQVEVVVDEHTNVVQVSENLEKELITEEPMPMQFDAKISSSTSYAKILSQGLATQLIQSPSNQIFDEYNSQVCSQENNTNTVDHEVTLEEKSQKSIVSKDEKKWDVIPKKDTKKKCIEKNENQVERNVTKNKKGQKKNRQREDVIKEVEREKPIKEIEKPIVVETCDMKEIKDNIVEKIKITEDNVEVKPINDTEKKRKPKKKKIDTHHEDEIDKALKEIAALEKQKNKFQKDKEMSELKQQEQQQQSNYNSEQKARKIIRKNKQELMKSSESVNELNKKLKSQVEDQKKEEIETKIEISNEKAVEDMPSNDLNKLKSSSKTKKNKKKTEIKNKIQEKMVKPEQKLPLDDIKNISDSIVKNSSTNNDDNNEGKISEPITHEDTNNSFLRPIEELANIDDRKQLSISFQISDDPVTVTTTTTCGETHEMSLSAVTSVKSTEILENVPLLNKTNSKSEEIINLRPDNVEANLTTTYVRVSNDSTAAIEIEQEIQEINANEIQISADIKLMPTPIIEFDKDDVPLFGSVQARRNSQKSDTISIESFKSNISKSSVNGKDTEKFSRDKNTKNNKKQIDHTNMNELIKPYWIDYHAYNEAESYLYRNFKVVRVIEGAQSSITKSKPKSCDLEQIGRVPMMEAVHDKLKKTTTDILPSKNRISENDVKIESSVIALIEEIPRYSLPELLYFESQWAETLYSRNSLNQKIQKLKISTPETEVDSNMKPVLSIDNENKLKITKIQKITTEVDLKLTDDEKTVKKLSQCIVQSENQTDNVKDMKYDEFCIVSDSFDPSDGPINDSPSIEHETVKLPSSPLPKTKATNDLVSKSGENQVEICEMPTSKVQFYIDEDDIVVISHLESEEVHLPKKVKTENLEFIQQPVSTISPLKLTDSIGMDSFWVDKRMYHDAELKFFEDLSSKLKKKVININNYFDHRDNNDDFHDNFGGGSGPGEGSLFNSYNESSLAPRTERLVADLPGGICSWNDYSTYLSLRQDKTRIDVRQTRITQPQQTYENSHFSLHSSSSSSSVDSLSFSKNPFLTSCNILPHPPTFSYPFDQHLGLEMKKDQEQDNFDNRDLEGNKKKADSHGISQNLKISLESSIEDIEKVVSQLEESLKLLPQDNMSKLFSIFLEKLEQLQKYDEQVSELYENLIKLDAEVDTEKLMNILKKVQNRITVIRIHVEEGVSVLEKIIKFQQQREMEINTYKNFLDETDIWLKNLILTITQLHSIASYKMLENELNERVQSVIKLEALPEISALAKSLKEALLKTNLQLKEKQKEIEEDETICAFDDLPDQDDKTLDQASSIHSIETEVGIDVSLQTGQSLMRDEKPIQLTKQTLTEMGIQTAIPIQVLLDDSKLAKKESIKILKTTDDTHDVIEIATRNIPATALEKFLMHERAATISDDIVVDMKYQDAKLEKSAVSELNIEHAAPQTFETILTEPEDVTTEVLIDADGTKKIVVRKLKKVLVTSDQVSQKHVTPTTREGAQSFIETATDSQQVTLTQTKTDGSIEMSTKQILSANKDFNMEEIETIPQTISDSIPKDLVPSVATTAVKLIKETDKYQTHSSTVHTMVQQATRRVIIKTRKTIKKITIIDGKEIMTEETIEEPEEVQIDEQNIPHISINVIKQTEQKLTESNDVRDSEKEINVAHESIVPSEFISSPVLRQEQHQAIDQPNVSSIIHQETEVNKIKLQSTVELKSKVMIDSKNSEILQSKISDVTIDKAEPDSVITEENRPVDDTVFKLIDAPVKSPVFDIDLETGTVEVVQHSDDSTVVSPSKSDDVLLEKLQDKLIVDIQQVDSPKLSYDDIDSPANNDETMKKLSSGIISVKQMDITQSKIVTKNISEISSISVDQSSDIEAEKMKQQDDSDGSIATTIAESVEINFPLSDSPKQPTEQAQSDILENTETSLSFSCPEEENLQTGYESDDGTTLEDNLVFEEHESTVFKKKKKKKKKQKVYENIEENTEVPKSTTDEMELTDNSCKQEEKLKIEKKRGKKHKQKDKKLVQTSAEIDTQTQIVETRDVSANVEEEFDHKSEKIDSFHQTSSEPIELNVLEQEIQTLIHEEINMEMQTSPIPALDSGIQTLIPTEINMEMQTSPTPVSNLEIQTLAPEEINIEIQTSPTPMLDSEIQTIAIELPAKEDLFIQTDLVEIVPAFEKEEEESQTSLVELEPIIPIKETEEIEVQTTIAVDSSGVQTLPIETKKLIEIDVQTENQLESLNAEQQTTPKPEIIQEEVAIQVGTEIQVVETDVQTSEPLNTLATSTNNFEMQANLIEDIVVATMATQTTPKNSPCISIEEVEVQTSNPQFIVESVMQTSPEPIDDGTEPIKLLNLSTQTSLEEKKIVTEQESQTTEHEKSSLDTCIQTMTNELTPTIEEYIQNVPEITETSLQTSDSEVESQIPISVASVSIAQQTTIQSVKVSTASETELNIREIGTSPIAMSKFLSDYEREKLKSTLELGAQPRLETEGDIESIYQPIKTLTDSPKLEESSQSTVITPNEKENITKEKQNKDQEIPETPIISEKESTDTSFEIHIQTTIELSDSLTPDQMTCEGESTNVTHKTIISEGDYEDIDPSINKSKKRYKKKKKQKLSKLKESSSPEKDQEPSDFTLSSSSIESKDPTIKLFYSEVTKKRGKKDQQKYQFDDQRVNLSLSIVDEKLHDSSSIDDNNISNDNLKNDQVVASTEVQQSNIKKQNIPEVINIENVPEPMDTSEELLSPMESIILDKTINTEKDEILWSDNYLQPQNERFESTASSPFFHVFQRTQSTKIILDRLKNLQNARETNCLSSILHIINLENISNSTNIEERRLNIKQELSQLMQAIENNDAIIIEQKLTTVIEIFSTWLEIIEYQVFFGKKELNDLSEKKFYNEMKDEVDYVEENIKELDKIWKEIENNYSEDEKEKIQECVSTLSEQAATIKSVINNEEQYATTEQLKWNELLCNISNLFKLIKEQSEKLNGIVDNELTTTIWKLEELDKLDNTNRFCMEELNQLLTIIRNFLINHPDKNIPEDTYVEAYNLSQSIDNKIGIERERLFQLLSLAEEYEQTLQEFSQITDIAENLLASPISVVSLEHLRDEMQKHRKFFVNLNHCRAILESLEDNLDNETRLKHSKLHEKLHSRAITLLDQAASKAQQMSLAASRWMLLEQGIKEERGWLQVAHQRVPDLQPITSTDYDQYISLYQSLSSNIATHHSRIIQLLNLASSLKELINIEDSEDRYQEALDVICQLQENVDMSLRQLLLFRDNWTTQELLINRLEKWITSAERDLGSMQNDWEGHMRYFWELKAQYEVHNNIKNEANYCFEQALRIIPLSDEMIQRQFYGEFQDRWHKVAKKIKTIQKAVADTITSEETPVDEKLRLLKIELNELQTTIEGFHGVLKTEDELELYVEKLGVLFERVCTIQDELSKLGILSATESEKVSVLLSSARKIESQIGEELDLAQLVKERLQSLQRGLTRIRKAHIKQALSLDECENCENQASDIVAGGVEKCQQVIDELAILWKDLMGLRQLLHTLPNGMKISISPVGIERDISSLLDDHTDLESRCTRLLSLLRNRLNLWRRFEKQLELVQQSVQEADYMMELLSIQGTVDYERLLKATERLEGLNGDLGAREILIGELREAAEPLQKSCSPDIGEKVNAAVNEAIQAWENTKAELDALCIKYQHAVKLWEQYRDSSAAVKAWVDTQMGSVTDLPPEEALKQVKVCEETLAEHKQRLAELRGLVAQIASDVGLDTVNGPLQYEVEALGRRLEDVRETLATLADTADARALNHELTRGDLCQTKNFLDSVQQSLSSITTTIESGESKEQLNLLRNHLLALTRTEPQLQSIKDRRLDIVTTETSVVEILQLWQSVFRETFQQYHRLSARLVRSEDVSATLRLWQEYLSHVQEFLSTDIPGDYNGLSEHRNLCQVHKNLLTDQQHLILSIQTEKKSQNISVAEQFNVLTNFHNETLSKIMERHASVRDRLAAWDKYKSDQSKLLTWLKDIEREKNRLQLRFIHLRRLDKIILKIETLLEKIPVGQAQINSLNIQQNSLLINCEEALAVSVRMEHAANTQRLTNLRASLETWRDFVLRIRQLNAKHVNQTSIITETFQEISQALSTAFHTTSTNLIQVKQKLNSLQNLKSKLIDSTANLETLGVTTEQLCECLSPSDMKNLNQQIALLWQQHGDLEHQLALLAYKLGQRLNLRGKWDTRLSRFIIWVTDTESKIHGYNTTTTIEEPEEALKKLEGELHAEMTLKQREFEWLQTTGQELINNSNEDEKIILKKSLDDLNERWNQLMNVGKAKANKLIDLMQTISLLEKSIAEIRGWLGKIELQLVDTFTIESKTQSTIDKKLKDHELLQKAIEEESGKIGEIFNLCEILLNDCDAWKVSFNTDTIKNGMHSLEKRWKATCVRSADRKRKIIMAWKLIQELDKIKQDQEQWITEVENELKTIEESIEKKTQENTEQTISRVKVILKNIDVHKPALIIVEQNYSKLSKSGLEPGNFKVLTTDVRSLLDRWQALKPKANSIISSLQHEQKIYREFISAHGSAVVGLTQIDVKLTQLQHLSQDDRFKYQQIIDIDKDLTVQNNTLQHADELALIVMQNCCSSDIPAIQELVDEYQLLWRDIKTRVTTLKANIEENYTKEVDEAVQVETLKFEQDSAVQVDTLPRLMRMTSCDAYLIELQSALSECQCVLEELEDAITPEPVAGPGIASTAKHIAKLIGSCQSAIELVKHLHSLLMQDEKYSNEAAKIFQVEELNTQYEDLLIRARAREQQIKEIRSPSIGLYSFSCEHDKSQLLMSCPVCSRRNWTQVDIDLWRLEKWLEYAEGIQKNQYSPPSNIEELEDIIQTHREFCLDQDSHKNIIISLNIVGSHLADHTDSIEKAEELRDRLITVNRRWDLVCQTAKSWQTTLQSALMNNQQFRQIVNELLDWLVKTESLIHENEPIDLMEATDVIRLKFDKFRELQSDLERCEPRVLSLQEAANQLLDEHSKTRKQLQELRLQLQSLRRLTSIYTLKLGAALGLDPQEVGLTTTSSSLATLSHDLLDKATSGTSQLNQASTTDGDNERPNGTILVRGYRFVGRVLRASLPIQALMLLLLGVASLVPTAEDDYSCMLSNNLASTLTPVLNYPNGPPPL